MRQFCILERQVELIRRQLFGAFAEPLSPCRAQDFLQPAIGILNFGQLRLDLGEACAQTGVFTGKSSGFHGVK